MAVMALANAAESLPGTKNPFTPSQTISRFPPTSVATIGTLDAAASKSTMGRPSHAEDITYASAPAINFATSSRKPKNRTLLESPSSVASCKVEERNGPSPAMRKRLS